jgi:hypothetical protein
MTPSDDILDLLGRYATGSLTEEERKRLFDAAIDDQELFEQLLQEQDIKQLLDQPGARERMIHALEPPRRKTAWIFGIAATAALSVVLMVMLMRPAPKPPQIAETKVPPPPSTAVQTESAPAPVAEPQPTPAPKAKAVENRREEPAADKPQKDAEKKEAEPARDAVALPAPAAAPPPPVVAPRPAAPARAAASSQAAEVQAAASQVQQNQVVSGPKQRIAAAGRLITPATAADEKAPAFGFHYSTDIQGHLSIIPAADGFLFVKSNDGKVLFGPKLSAAGIIVDLPIADTVTSVTITFSETADPVQTKPALHTEVSGNVGGAKALAVEIKVK